MRRCRLWWGVVAGLALGGVVVMGLLRLRAAQGERRRARENAPYYAQRWRTELPGLVVSIGLGEGDEPHALLLDGRDVVLDPAHLSVVHQLDLAHGRPLIPVALPLKGAGLVGVLYRDEFRESRATWSETWRRSSEPPWSTRRLLEVEALFYVAPSGRGSRTFDLRGEWLRSVYRVGRWQDSLVVSDEKGCRGWSLADGRLLWELAGADLVAVGEGAAACLVASQRASPGEREVVVVGVKDGRRVSETGRKEGDYGPAVPVYDRALDGVATAPSIQVAGPSFLLDDWGWRIGGQPAGLQRILRLPGGRLGDRLWDTGSDTVVVRGQLRGDLGDEFQVAAFDGASGKQVWRRHMCIRSDRRGLHLEYYVQAALVGGAVVVWDNSLPPPRSVAALATSSGKLLWQTHCYDVPSHAGGLVCFAQEDGTWALVEPRTGVAIRGVDGVVTGPLPPAVAAAGDRIYWSPDEHSVCGAVRVHSEGK